jgi:hypothetical protein
MPSSLSFLVGVLGVNGLQELKSLHCRVTDRVTQILRELAQRVTDKGTDT